ncbi:MAG: SMC family ATPase [Clostridia bacterium]|nr:SMC family ATPase [Clostridia bacterium]
MRPLRLEMQAFGPYVDRQALDFSALMGRNFFLIHGPTGSGKTTILDAMCFALYGQSSATGREYKQLRSDFAPVSLPTHVLFDFAVGPEIYRVERRFVRDRTPSATIWRRTSAAGPEDEGAVVETSTSRVTAKVVEILGLEPEQFRQVVLLPQGEFRKVLSAKTTERQQILEILFQTGRYREIEQALKDAAKSISTDLGGLTARRKQLLEDAGAENEDALAATHEKTLAAQRGAKDDCRRAAEEVQKASAALASGQRNWDKLDEERKAREVIKALEGAARDVDRMRDEHKWAKLAASCAEKEALFGVSQGDARAAAERCEKAKSKLTEAEEESRKSQEAYEAEALPQREEERKRASQAVVRLESLIPVVQAIDKARTCVVEAGAAMQKCGLRRDKTARSRAAVQEELTGARQGKDEAQAKATYLPKWEEDVRALREALGRAAKIAKLNADLGDKRTAHGKAARAVGHAENELLAARAELDGVRTRWAQGRAAALAAMLTDGQPCPVCGSIHHPAPAEGAEQAVADDTLRGAESRVKAMETAVEAAQAELSRTDRDCAAVAGRLEELQAADQAATCARGVLNDDLSKALADAQARVREAENAASAVAKLAKEIVQAETALRAAEDEVAAAESEFSEAQAIGAAAKASLEEREAGVDPDLRAPDALERALADAKRVSNALADALEKARKAAERGMQNLASARSEAAFAADAACSANEAFEKSKAALEIQIAECGFAGAEEYAHAKRSRKHIEELESRIGEYDKALHSASERLARAVEAASGLEEPDLETLALDAARMQDESNKAIRAESELAQKADREQLWQKGLSDVGRSIAQAESEYRVMGRISEAANGGNSLGITFERFVLASMMEQVTDAANQRLGLMSRGRYSLRRASERSDGRSAGGLDLEVNDAYTDAARSVSTLSGGEGFEASLALALGLADVVQSHSGGIHLDTIFVDEGFGTLDPEALDLALNTLIDLQRERGRLVGVISHVPELQERIDARLEVQPTDRGSTVRFVVG